MSQTSINVPSSEEISFKLSENILSSMQNSKPFFMPIESSLQYTNSRISIQEHMPLPHESNPFSKKNEGFSTLKDFSQKTTCINSVGQNSLKSSVRNTSRVRSFSIKKVAAKPLSILFNQNIKFDSNRSQNQNSKIKNKIKFTKRSNKVSSHHQKQQLLINSELIRPDHIFQGKASILLDIPELFNLKKSFLIKQIQLKTDENKYLQNRSIAVHLDQMQFSRKTSRNSQASKRY